jgi:hypothetical protein
MHRMIIASLAALGLVVVSQDQASAYSKFTFGVGMNLGMEGGGNSVLWGAYKGSPAPGMGFQGGYCNPYGGAIMPHGGPAMPFPGELPPAPEKNVPVPIQPNMAKPAGYYPIQQMSYPEMVDPPIYDPYYPVYLYYYGQ